MSLNSPHAVEGTLPTEKNAGELSSLGGKELPHLVVNEPKRGLFGTLGVVILSLLVLGIPLGVYLVSQRTQLTPQAAVIQEEPEALNGIFLESKLSPESLGGVIPVDVYLKSPVDAVNLVSTKISFDPSVIKVEKIATGSGEFEEQSLFNKWIEVSFDNQKGNLSIISGLPSPGINTQDVSDQKVYLATIHLKPQKTGTAILQITSESQILRNSDNQNIFKTGNDLVLNLTGVVEATNSAELEDKEGREEPLIVITEPLAAKNYSYFKPIDIQWSSFNVERISQINLYVNGELLGPIAKDIDEGAGQYSWDVQETIPLPYIQLSNVFSVEIIGETKNGEVAKVVSGPFGILGIEEVIGSPPNLQTFTQNQLTVIDVSRALSNYLVLPLKDKQSLPPSEIKSLDLNKDEVVNDLDIFLVRQNLLVRGVIR